MSKKSFLEKFKEDYQKAQQKNAAINANPNSDEAKKMNKKLGLVGIVVGLVFAVATYFAWLKTGRIVTITSAIALGSFVGGLWMLVTGKK